MRTNLAFALGWAAVVLRFAGEWMFPGDGPFALLVAQAALLAAGVAFLWRSLGSIFLRGGNHAAGIREGLLALPIGLLLGAVTAYAASGALDWLSPDRLAAPLVGNLLFTAIEEVEFRGFLLALLLRLGLRPSTAVGAQALIHTLAHGGRVLGGYYISLLVTLVMTLWFGSITLRSRSLWGAWIAHLSWNMAIVLPQAGAGLG